MQKSNRKRNISTIIILAIVLLVPGFLYVALNRVGKNSYVKLPVYGDKVLSGEMVRKMGREIPDTIFHTIPSITLDDVSGQAKELFNGDAAVTVVHTFYGADNGLSMALLQSIVPVVERFSQNDRVKFVSISIDSTDVPMDLEKKTKVFREGLRHNWSIVYSKNNLSDFISKELLSDALAEGDRYIMSGHYLLVDSKGRIRGFYDINLKKDIDRLKDEIKVQLVEDARNNPSKIEKQ